MPKFSKHFNIQKTQPELDFVDVNSDTDIALYIDPSVFTKHRDIWSVECNELILSFFETVLDAIKAGDIRRGQELLDRLHEPNETCLGLSKGRPSGRGIGKLQAQDLFERLRNSRAAKSGLLADLSDCELFIEGIGPDKISDVTTNIIRKKLIEYTQHQCALHDIPLRGVVASGNLWNMHNRQWEQQYVPLPVIDHRQIILVPKASVRWNFSFAHEDYYDDFVLTFLQDEHLQQNTALVETLVNGRRRVTKKNLKMLHPLSKHFLVEFSEDHPEVLAKYKELLGSEPQIRDSELDENFDERVFAQVIAKVLPAIDRGDLAATKFHHFMVGVLEFLFYPNLIYPKKEQEIHEGRKRIDISYTNNAEAGFFFRRLRDQGINARQIYVECKNYMKEIANPELDQLAGRFSPIRGRLGFLVGRSFDNAELFYKRCRDTALDDRGFILPIVDQDVLLFLRMIEDGNRGEIDRELERRFQRLIG
jgi:hypothetical protein